MTKPRSFLHLLDLDGTLINTDALTQVIFPIAANMAGMKLEDFQTEAATYRTDAGYDLFLHLAAHHVTADTASSTLLAYIDGPRYQYPGATALIDALQQKGGHVQLVTTGAEAYQRFKISLCELPAWVPVTVTPINKGDYLRKHLAVTPDGEFVFKDQTFTGASLLDDKLSHLHGLLGHASLGMKLFWINRPGSAHATQQAPPIGVREVTTYQEVLAA